MGLEKESDYWNRKSVKFVKGPKFGRIATCEYNCTEIVLRLRKACKRERRIRW